MIQIENVGKVYATPRGEFAALRGVDLQVAEGEVFGIIGRSGAGKSTLLRLINLLERPSTGRIVIGGGEVTHLAGEPLRRLRHRMGMVFQHFNLLHSKTVAENVRLPLRVAGAGSPAEQVRRVAEVLDLVGIADQAGKYPGNLSGGQRQRVGIARALANRPQVLLCDEATSALDPQTTQSILRLLLEINRQLGLTVVLITHTMDVIRTVADRVAVLDHGRVVESGRVIDVFLAARHDVTRALLAESGVESTEGVAAPAGRPGRVLTLTYREAGGQSPVLTRLCRESGVDFTILQGSVGRLKGISYGRFTVAVEPMEDARFEQFLAAMRAQDIRFDVRR